MRKVGDGGQATVNVRLDNNGAVEVDQGILDLAGGGNSDGTFAAADGATLEFAGGTHVLSAASVITGAGAVQFAGTTSAATFIFSTYQVSGPTLITSGTANFQRDVTLARLTLNGTLSGPGTVTVAGELDWTAGTMSGIGRTVAAGPLVVSGAAFKVLDTRALDNRAAATWSGGGDFIVMNGSAVTNAAGATWTVSADEAYTEGFRSSMTPSFTNAGTLRVAAGTTRWDFPFQNDGAVDVQGGALDLAQGAASGSFAVAASAALRFSGGAYALQASSSVAGAGALTVSRRSTPFQIGNVDVFGAFTLTGRVVANSGGITFHRDVTLSSVDVMDVGVVGSDGNMTVSGPLTWTGGTLSGQGRINPAGGLSVSGINFKYLDGVELDLPRSTTWNTGQVEFFGGALLVVPAGGVLTVQAGFFFARFPGSILNNGTIMTTMTPGSPVQFSLPLVNAGTIQVMSGTLNTIGLVNQGTVTAAAGTSVLLLNGTLAAGSTFTSAGDVVVASSNFRLTVAGAFNVTGLVQILGGTVDFATNVTLGRLTQRDGTLTGTGDVTVTGLLTWTGGMMTGSGRVRANGGLSLTGGSRMEFGPTLSGRTFDNAGAATLLGNQAFFMNFATTFNNLAGATFDVQGDGSVQGVNAPAFNNAGAFRKSGGTGTSTLAVTFNNSGQLDLRAGTIVLKGGGDSTGSFTAGAGTTLNFHDGPHMLEARAAVHGAGTFLFGGTAGGQSVVTVRGTYDVTGSTRVAIGTAVFDRDTTLPNLTLETGLIDGAGNLTVTGPLVWTAGAMYGTGHTRALGGLTLGSGGLGRGRSLDNAGAAVWTGAGPLVMDGGTSFNNLAGASFDDRIDGVITGEQVLGSGVFNNAGTFVRSTSQGMARVLVPFVNSGTVDVRTGTLTLAGGSSQSGTLAIGRGAAVVFENGTHAFATTSHIQGPGTFQVGGFYDQIPVNVAGTFAADVAVTVRTGTLRLDSDNTLAALTLAGGTLTGPGSLVVTDTLTWSSGTMSGPGRTVSRGTATFGPAVPPVLPVLSGREFENAGSATGTIALTLVGNAQFHNLPGATFRSQGGIASNFMVSGRFVNEGLAEFSGPTSGVGAVIDNSGTLNVLSGSFRLDGGGTLSGQQTVAAGATWRFNEGSYFLTETASLSGAGNLIFGPPAVPTTASTEIHGDVAVGGDFTVGSGTVTLFHDVHSRTATITGGTLNGPNDLIVGALTWNGGTLGGAGTIRASGGLTLGNGSTFFPRILSGRTLDVSGAGTWTGTGDVALAEGATWILEDDATLDIQTNAFVLNSGAGGTLLNHGTLRRSLAGGTTTILVGFANTGLVDVAAGTLSLLGEFANFAADTGALTGGTFRVAGTLQFRGADVVTVAANLVLDGSGPGRITDPNGRDGLADLAAVDAAGSLTLQNAYPLGIAGDFLNAGRVRVESGSSLTVAGNLMNAGALLIDFTSGVFVAGDFGQGSSASLEIQLGGTADTGLFGQLTVAGTADLDGALILTPVNGYTPAAGDAFPVLAYGSRNGTFASPPPGWDLSYDDLAGSLIVTWQG